MPVTLINVADVPLCGTGTYALASGDTTFSAEDLADAVLASHDATIPAPRLKLGHTDPRFNQADELRSFDGEPAFGTVQNLRLTASGQEIIGDYRDMPEWLGDTLPSAYPGRSIEGLWNFTAASGKSYRLVITAVSLLGVTPPGIGSLDDLREVLERNGGAQQPVAAESGFDHEGGHGEHFFIARIARPGDQAPTPTTDVMAGLDIGNVRMQFCGDLDSGEVPQVPDSQPQSDDVGPQMWWWPRSVRVEDDGSLCLIVDDDEGHLIRIPFTVQQADLIYGAPELVIETYVPVTSDPDDTASNGATVTARGPRVLASWPARAASRPSTTTEVPTMDVDPAVLRKRLGLADDADDAAITEALSAEPTPVEASAPTEQSAPEIPEGMALVDQATLDELRTGAQAGVQVAARLARSDRDDVIRAAIAEGKFPAGRREHYETIWQADEEGARALIASLAPGLVPVGRREIGTGGDGESNTSEAEDHARFMASHFPNESSRLRNGRVRQEA